MIKTADYNLPDGTQGLAKEKGTERMEARAERMKGLSQTIRVYPNPAGNVVNFNNLEGASHLTIMDITGNIVHKIDVNDTSYQWRTTDVRNGIYFYTIYNDDTVTATGKVAINK